MKRDFDLIRKLLFKIEKFPASIQKDFNCNLNIYGYDKDTLNYHILLLVQAELLNGIIHRSVINKHIEVINETLELTWAGHDFVDSIRNDTIWKKIKLKIDKSNIPFEVIKDTLKILIQQSLK